MKSLLALALLLPTLLFAQNVPLSPPLRERTMIPGQRPAGAPVAAAATEVLPDNYQVTLVLKDAQGAVSEISVVTSAPRFGVVVGEQRLNFSGELSVVEDGATVVSYNLGWESPVPVGANNVQFNSSSIQGVVRIRPGAEPETIFRSPTRTAAIAVIKLPPGKAR